MHFIKSLKKLLFFILFFVIIVLAAPAASDVNKRMVISTKSVLHGAIPKANITSSLAGSGIFDSFGIIPEHGTHGSIPEENIDLFTGNLTLKNLDIHLPGPNGFDLNIWRVYNSKILSDYRLGTVDNINFIQSGLDWLGLGWSMHMGRLQVDDVQMPLIEFPDGQMEVAYQKTYGIPLLYTKSNKKLIYENNVYKLFEMNGTIWTFGTWRYLVLNPYQAKLVYLVTEIENSYGHKMVIEYNNNSPTLKKITDSMGRTVTFEVDDPNNACPALKNIYVRNYLGGTSVYTYTTSNYPDKWMRLLWQVKPPELPAASYQYYNNDNTLSYELYRYINSYGGTAFYYYDWHNFYFDFIGIVSKVLKIKEVQFSSGDPINSWSYSYPSYQTNYDRTVTVFGPKYNSMVTYFAHTSDSQVEPKIDYWTTGLIQKKWSSDNSIVEYYNWISSPITDLEWNKNFFGYYPINIGRIAAPLKDNVTITSIGNASFSEEFYYQRTLPFKYGLPTRIDTYINGIIKNRKTLEYYFENDAYFANNYMLNFLRSETLYEHYNYDSKLKETIMSYYTNGALYSVEKLKSGSTYLKWDYRYSSSGPSNITITIDPPGAGGIETMVYYYGVLAKLIHPTYTEFTRTISAYDSSILSETNQHGATMSFAYDYLGRVTAIDMPSGFNDITESWSNNNVTITQGGNKVIKYWDGMGRNTGHVEQGDGITLFYRKNLDGEGRTTYESKGSTDAADTYSYLYNAAGQITKITDPLGKITTVSMSGNQKIITDANNKQTTFEYNDLPGLVGTLTDPAGKKALYTYDDAGRLLNTVFNSSRTQSFVYNALDQVTEENHPETGKITYSYNADNNLQTKTWGGQSINYTYYSPSNQLWKEDAGDELITYSYDSNGRVASITGSLGWSNTSISYNSFGNVIKETITIPGLSGTKDVSYDYDGNNQLKQIIYPDGTKADYTNNGLNMPVTISFKNSTMVNAVTYGIGKQPLSINNSANGTSFLVTYNKNGNLSTAQLKKSSTSLYNADYGYDGVGNITSLSNTTPNLNVNFSYDNLNRLIKAYYNPSNVGRIYDFDYYYDEYGNMTSVRENSATVFSKTYTNQNWVNGSSFDARGNVTQGDGFSQVWDNRNRLKESRITANNSLLGRYLYNERGLRLKAEHITQQPMVQVVQPNGGENLYLDELTSINWSSMGLTGTLKLELLVNDTVAGVIADNVPASQTSYQWQVGKILTGSVSLGTNFKVRISSLLPLATTYYFYDSGGRLLSEYDSTGVCVKDYIYMGSKLLAEYQPSGSKYYYYTSDQINSTRIITDNTGTVVYSALFDPYGGMQKEWVNTYQPSLKFSGKEREGISELDYFGARYYGHKQYRFLSVDPVINKDEALANPQLWNLYSYCRNNPITYLDPDGRDFVVSTEKWRGEGYGHLVLFYQGEDRNWNRFEMGPGPTPHIESFVPAVASSKRVEAPPNGDEESKYGTTLSSYFKTTISEDISIEKSVNNYIYSTNVLNMNQYNPLFHNCKDAVIDVITNAHISWSYKTSFHYGLPPFDSSPNIWFLKYMSGSMDIPLPPGME